jgi:hypothetical protein
VVVLNALSLSRWVSGVDRIDPGSCESEIFRGRGFSSSGPRASQNAVEGARRGHVDADRAGRIRVGGALIRFLGGFRARIPQGFTPFNRRFWVPLI